MKTTIRHTLWMTGAAIGFLLAACGGEGPADVGDGDGDHDPGTVDQDDGPTYTHTPNVVFHVTDLELDAPLRNAHVAFDGPDGTRLETTTNVHGDAVFSDIEWERDETASVVAYAPGYFLSAHVGLTEADLEETFEVYLGRRNIDDITLSVSGEAEGLSSSVWMNVATDQDASRQHNAQGSDYEILVTPYEPFTLSAYAFGQAVQGRSFYQDLHGWWRYDSEGIEEDMTLDLTEGMSVATEAVKGTLAYPGSNHPMQDDALLVVNVTAGENNLQVGMTTASTREPDFRRYDFEVTQWTAAGLDDVAARFFLFDSDRMVMNTVPGRLISGDYTVDFPTPPAVTSPGPGMDHSVYAPIEFTNPEPDARVVLIVWEWGRLDAPPGSTSITFPPAPSAADEDFDVYPGLFNREATAHLLLCEGEYMEACHSVARAPELTLLR